MVEGEGDGSAFGWWVLVWLVSSGVFGMFGGKGSNKTYDSDFVADDFYLWSSEVF